MKHNDSELLMLDALGVNSPGDQRRVRRLTEKSDVAAQRLELNRDLVARLTLAKAPTLLTPPSDLCRKIGLKIAQEETRSRRRTKLAGVIGAVGWLAAACLALYAIIFLGSNDNADRVDESHFAERAYPIGLIPKSSMSDVVAESSGEKNTKLAEVQTKLAEMQKTVQELQAQVQQPGSIKIRQFGSSKTAAGAGASNPVQTMVDVLAKVVQPMVAGGRIAATDSEIVIERGFGAFDAETLPEGYVFRHRAFPVEQWKELGLYRDGEGRFYDPIGGLIWEPSADESGSYVSVMPGSQADLSSFVPPNASTIDPSRLADSQNRMTSEPRVIAITDSGTGQGKLVIGNADKLASPVQGKVPMIWIGQKSPSGSIHWMRVGSLDMGAGAVGEAPPAGLGSTNRNNPVAVFEINPQMNSLLNGSSNPLFGVSHQWPTVLPPTVPTEQVHTFGD